MRIRPGVISLLCLGLQLTFASAAHAGCPRIIYQWTDPETEIRQPTFSADGSMIAFTARGHIPDAGEAESFFNQKKLERYIARKMKIAGFDEPHITVLHLDTGKVETGPSGWEPCFSADAKAIFFAMQTHPISGHREVNETLEGNGIAAFDFRNGSTTTLAHPDTGFDTSPALGPDPSMLFFRHHGAGRGYQQTPLETLALNLNSRQQSHVADGSMDQMYCYQMAQRAYPTLLKSPDGTMVAEFMPELTLDDEKAKPLRIIRKGKEVCSWSPPGDVWEAVWSPDSSKLAVVAASINYHDPSAYKDHLIVFDMRPLTAK
jgi:hypothetical protein